MREIKYREGIITPDYLTRHGFQLVESESEAQQMGLDAPFFEGWLNYFETELHRQRFAVLIGVFNGGPDAAHSIYVQEDIGCGWVQIPNGWYGMPIDYFESIYYGIRGKKP